MKHQMKSTISSSKSLQSKNWCTVADKNETCTCSQSLLTWATAFTYWQHWCRCRGVLAMGLEHEGIKDNCYPSKQIWPYLLWEQAEARLSVQIAPFVPDRRDCNWINDFEFGGTALIDTSLGLVVADMLNPSQHRTQNGNLTQVRLI